MMAKLAIILIKMYRYFISPFLGSNCRFYPSCSSYALIAIERFGFLRGSYLAIKRVLKCHPGCPGGEDPVPDKTQHHKQIKSNCS